MAKVNISNVVVKNNPAPFQDAFQFEITFECIEDLNEDLEWKIIYVGSAESEDFDQVLDTVVVGPIISGRHMFVFEADAPDVNKIPKEDAVGVTVVLLTCAYRSQEFIRVGYYVNNEYESPELKENPPQETDFSKLQRNILATCPRVTRFKIDWGSGEEVDSENVPPTNATENESNQMAVTDSSLAAPKNTQEETMDAPLPGKIDSSSTAASSVINSFNGICGTDSNNAMDMVPGHAVPANGGCGEPMQL